MIRPKNKPQVKATLNIRPGPASPAQKAAWHELWAKILADVKNEAAK